MTLSCAQLKKCKRMQIEITAAGVLKKHTVLFKNNGKARKMKKMYCIMQVTEWHSLA